jgi:hypothetical protein
MAQPAQAAPTEVELHVVAADDAVLQDFKQRFEPVRPARVRAAVSRRRPDACAAPRPPSLPS